MLGTLIPQMREAPDNVQTFTAAHPSLGLVFEKIGFFNIYYSWWFIALLSLMAFNVIVCKIVFGKYPGPRTFKEGEKNAAFIAGQKFKGEFEVSSAPDAAARQAEQALAKKGFSVERRDFVDGSALLLAAKHRPQRFGSWVSHICILMILLANVVGFLYGFRENLEIPEGGWTEMRHRPWRVECDDFTVDFYDETATPKTFSSDLRIFQEHELIAESKILVNEPLEHQGVRFYQATYAPFLKHAKLGLFMKKNPDDSTPPMLLKQNEEVRVPGTPYSLKILQFIPAFYLDENQKAASRSPNLLNPAVKLLISKNGQPVKSPWIFVNFPGLQMPPMQEMDEFIPVLAETVPGYFTGIQAAYDPGADMFWLGCTVFVLSLMVLFYLHHRKIWVLAAKDAAGRTVVRVGASSSRGNSFELEFQDILQGLKSIS